MTTRRVIFPGDDYWTQRKDTTMTEKPISPYQPPEGMVLVVGSNFDFFYDQIDGRDIIGIAAHDDRLGPIAFLFGPEAAAHAGRSLIEMSTTELERLRAGYDNRFEG